MQQRWGQREARANRGHRSDKAAGREEGNTEPMVPASRAAPHDGNAGGTGSPGLRGFQLCSKGCDRGEKRKRGLHRTETADREGY